MSTQSHFFYYLRYSIAAAVVYCIPVFFFVRNADYTYAWLLYLGNAFFLITISIFMLSFNRRRREDASSATMLIAGHVTSALGVILACTLAFIILTLLVPGLFDHGTAGKVLTEQPANMVNDKTNGLNFMVFANAIFGNISAGSFASIIFAFTVKRDQTKESVTLKKREL